MNQVNAPRGTRDKLPQDSAKWQYIEAKISEICRKFDIGEIRTPVFEHTELFVRGIGDGTDVVQKEMYTFNDKGNRSITLRPEGTAGAVRAYLEHNLYANPAPTRLYYFTNCYRYEKPQAGRLREFNQFGIEIFGAENPIADSETITVAVEVLEKLGLQNINIGINSVGCADCKQTYNSALRGYFAGKSICELCSSRLEKNPMRVLDCKAPCCQEIAENAPKTVDYLCETCDEHFTGVQENLKAIGVNFKVDSSIVRGLDYYTKTVFELTAGDIGAQNVVCGGGRYDNLIEELGGKPTPAVGFGMGMERLLLCLEKYDILPQTDVTPDIFVGWIGSKASGVALKLAQKLREEGKTVNLEVTGRSPKAQMKYADKLGAKYACLIGDNEIVSGSCMMKNMATGEEEEIKL
jgi:histidyl-tRNA synthetase